MDFTLDFKCVEFIGEGAHGTVYSVEEQSTKQLFACKNIEFASSRRSRNDVKKEILALQKMRHTHIVTISLYSQTMTGIRILILPLADYDLKQFMTKCAQQDFPADMTKSILSWFGCLLQALRFAHSNRVKHRDIKLENILIKNTETKLGNLVQGFHVYLSDFSLAKDFTGEEASVAVDEMPAGSPRYRAPEIRATVGGGRKADVFSLGCVYAEMLSVVCHKHFEELKNWCEAEHQTDIFRDSLPAMETWPAQLKGDLEGTTRRIMWKTIRNMIHRDLDMRHTADEALKSVEEIPDVRCSHVY